MRKHMKRISTLMVVVLSLVAVTLPAQALATGGHGGGQQRCDDLRCLHQKSCRHSRWGRFKTRPCDELRNFYHQCRCFFCSA